MSGIGKDVVCIARGKGAYHVTRRGVSSWGTGGGVVSLVMLLVLLPWVLLLLCPRALEAERQPSAAAGSRSGA
jgi:hypothetical protein